MAGRRAAGEGALFQRKTGRHKGKWIARIRTGLDENGHFKRKDLLFDTQAQAKAKLKEMIVEKEKGHEPAAKSPILIDYLESWLENRVKSQVARNTYERYRCGVMLHVKPDAIANLRLRTIKAAKINDFMDRLAKKNVGSATRASVRATLSAAFQQAVKEELVYDNQVRASDAPRQAEKRIVYLNEDEARTLLAKIQGDSMEALIVTAVFTGMRESELLGLTWEQVDFNRGTILIDRQLQRHDKAFYSAQLKTRGGRRTIPLAETAADKLRALKGASLLSGSPTDPQFKDLVFLSASGKPQHRKTILSRTNELMEAAGVPQVGFHALRHTCASILINRGADALRVQRQLGHANVRITLDTYGHLFEERLKDNVNLLEQAFRL